MKLYYDIKDKPKFPNLIIYAVQQLLAIMAATLVVPIIIGNGMQPSAALFGAGVGTLIYVLFTKASSPVFLGSSFAFLGSMAAAFAGAVSALANHDSISQISADYTVDGDISLGIKDTAYITLRVQDKHFTTIKQRCENPRAIMEFADLDLAAGLFAGNVSTINEMCKGTIRLRGMISMLDNVNRILDRVSVYLG